MIRFKARNRITLWGLTIVLFASAGIPRLRPRYGQIVTASLSGFVTDPAGAAVPEASVLALVLRETALVGVGGLVIGIAAAVPLPRLFSTVLEGVPLHQMPLLAGVAVVIASVVLLASYIPARRATKVDPMVALRHE